MQKITTHLWFDDQAEEAAQYYIATFGDGRIVETHQFPGPDSDADDVVTVTFELFGQQFIALNGGQQDFHFNESVSLYVECDDQEEVDRYWSKLVGDGGREIACGWLRDKYGLPWQIVPKQLTEALSDPDPAAAKRAMNAMLGMKKIDIEGLRSALQPQG